MQWNQSIAEKRISDMKMPDMPLVPIKPQMHTVSPDWFTQYKKLCHEFMRSLSDCVQELALMNLGREEFMDLLMGRAVPNNLSFRFRTPLVWGGKMEIDNMFMCATFPQSQNLDRFIIDRGGEALKAFREGDSININLEATQLI